ncbi:retinitis pigmentosa 1-like 1 protein [Pungitius pungitius]|uniref:retinitis pigmentosa 1-like 1 protein n=1 Tax=Pungitius pungitius TaxID=134920 RepID=UPI002E135A33
MHLVHAEMWDPRPPCKHASPLTPRTPSNRLTTASPAKRITFYKSGDSQFGGVRMAVHKRSFKCFDALLDDLSQKVPLPFGVRTVTTPRGTHAVKHLEQLQDGGCYLCSDRRPTKPVNMELAGKRPSGWYHHSRGPQRPESSSATPPGHSSNRQRRILLVKNSEPGVRRSLVLSRRSTRSLRAFLDEASEVMQFHIRKLYTAEGRRIDSVQSLTTCPGVLVCVGREAFSPVLVNFIRKSSEEKLPGLGPRTPGNGARSPARSPPHGAQSSEYSEGPESKKNVNFGLETKKSIIHPRSDSSNRSARFSLSSEKSYGNGVSAYSHARPAIMNDDIEKRVLVNKDGSLSVEMRVRFRLQSDETLQWSTQVKKSPSVTNECCPPSQAEADYLQQGQSESCSDPGSASFDPEGVDYSNQPPQQVLEGNTCPCCYQRPKQQYDLWENPAHSHRKPPVPPQHASGRTHTVRRHTHSSSSSSSCSSSRRVVRCRARVSSGAGGPEQSQLVREEMFVSEHVERRVEVEQDEETHVEVCTVSRCCSRTEVVAIDEDRRPLSRKSVEDEVMMEEEGQRSMSAISCSSHVLQSLKGDQDDDLPASASQCCHSNRPSTSPTRQDDEPTSNAGSVHSTEQKDEETGSRAVSAASSCHCGAADKHSTAEAIDRARSSMSKTSRASGRSSTAVITEEKRAAEEEEEEEGNRVVSSLSGHSGLSLQSRASSVCPNCGGCKLNSDADSRASQKSHHSKQASPKPSKPFLGQTDVSNGSDDDDGSEGSAGSTRSNKSNLTQNGRCSATPNGLTGGAHSATSRTSNPELAGTEDVRTPSASSATSQRSNRSHTSGCKESGAAEGERRSPSALSAVSHKSHCSAAAGIEPREEAEGDKTEERTQTSLSAKSGASAKSSASAKNRTKVASPINMAAVEDDDKRTAHSDKPGRQERPESVLSSKSAKSNASATFCAACSQPEATGQDEGIEKEERAVSAMSAKSNISVKSNISQKSTKAPERPLSPRCGTGADGEERSASQVSGRSVSGRSSLSASSAKSRRTNSPAKDVAETEGRTPSAMSGKSHVSAKSSTSQKSNPATASLNPNDADIPPAEMNGDPQTNENGRVASVLSVKSKASTRSRASNKSGKYLKPSTPNANVTIKTPDGVDEEGNVQTERPQSAASVKSTVSTSSCKSQHNATAETVDKNVVEEDPPRSKSQGRELSPRSACPSQTRSPKAESPVQQLFPAPSHGETRGPSALSVPSTVSAKSSKSKCSCGAASTKDERQREKKRSDEELDNEAASDRAASILSSSTRRSRRESGGTEQPLSRNSSGSVSLGLPEDQDSADSDSGKSSVSFHTNVERKSKVMTATPLVPESTEQSSPKEETPHNHRAVDIPTIETPGGSQLKGEEDGEQTTERGASVFSAKSSRSNKSSCNCGVKAAEPTETGNYLETSSVKSGSSSSNAGAVDGGRSSARAKGRSKSPASAKNASVKSKADDSVKGHKAKASGSVRSSSSQKREIKSLSPSPVHSNGIGDIKVETHTESTLSHSLSAADLLKETMAMGVRPHSQQSKASKTSAKSAARKGARSRNGADREDPELSPACLPNASPNEVVSDWLRSIPANGGMLSLGDEPNEEEEVEENPKEGGAEEEEALVEVEEQGKEEAEEGEEEEAECGGVEEKQGSGVAPHDSVSSRPKTLLLNDDSLPRSLRSSAAVMKILLRSSLSRCQSMPEVSPVYGRKLSSSARCLLDCLAQLQVIDPSLSPGFDPKKDQHYEDIMVILQSQWLNEPRNVEIDAAKIPGTEQVSPPRSSSGLGMSSGSGGSGKDKENGNQPAGDTTQSKTNEAEKVVRGGTPDKQGSLPPGVDAAKGGKSPSSSGKSSANGCCKSPTDNERETTDDTSSTTPSTVLRAPMSRRKSQDPDPVWVLKLLKKLEKQFMDHYVSAMAEFKVRWDLDDNLVLNAMIGELKDEVSRRIQSSVECEVRKIQSRAGRGGRLPRPPQRGNLSKESTITENRRRILKVIKNQSRKTAESLSDGETTGDCSDQRSDDEYCPCDACVLKKMAARPVRENPLAAEAPVMMEFDLLKILQLKKTPAPAAVPAQPAEGGEDSKVSVEEGRSLEVLQEVEEEDEEEDEEDVTKEDIKACVVLEETIPEEDEEMGEEEEEEEAEAGVEEVEAEREESSAGEEQVEEEEGGEEAGEEETSGNGKEEEADCKCQSARNEEGEEETTEGDDAEETSNNSGEDETGDDGMEEGETGSGEEESDMDTVKEADDVGKEEEAEGDECEVSDFKEDTEETAGRDSLGEEASGESEGDDAAKREGSTLDEEGNVNATAGDEEDGDDGAGEGESNGDKTGGESEEQGGEASEEERTSPKGPSATEGEEADGKRPSDTSGEEGEGRGSTIKGGGALLHQYTRTSVESQPGSLEDADAEARRPAVDSMAVPKATGGGSGQRRSRSPGRVQRRKPKEADGEREDF